MFPGAVHLSFFFRATFKEYVHCLYVVPISHGMLLGVDVMVETRVENVAAIMTIVNFLKVTMIFFCLGLQKAQKNVGLYLLGYRPIVLLIVAFTMIKKLQCQGG